MLADRLDAADEAAARVTAERHRSVTQQVYLASWTAAQEVRGRGTAGTAGFGFLCARWGCAIGGQPWPAANCPVASCLHMADPCPFFLTSLPSSPLPACRRSRSCRSSWRSPGRRPPCWKPSWRTLGPRPLPPRQRRPPRYQRAWRRRGRRRLPAPTTCWIRPSCWLARWVLHFC